MEEIFFKEIDPRKTKITHIRNQKEHIETRRADCEALLAEPQIPNTQCLVCGNKQQTELFSANGFPWIKCGECGHLYKKHMPDYESLLQKVRDSTVEVYLDETSIEYRLEHITKAKFDFMMKYYGDDRGRWLDLATGLADLPHLLVESGWEVEATELNASFVNYATKAFSITPRRQTLPEYFAAFEANNSDVFDVVGAFGYFDMLPNPVDHIQMINRLLRMNGLVGINIPNCESLTGALAEHLPDTSLRAITPIDFSYFSKQSMTHMLENAGFEVLGIWWHGLDIHELMIRIQELDPSFANSRAMEIMNQTFNELQRSIDEARLSDTMLMCARKIKNIS